jgi:ferredoxin/flavodoxin
MMKLIHSFLGRRQFVIAFVSSTLSLVFGRVARAFDLLFQKSRSEASGKPGADEKNSLKGIVVYYSATGNTAKVANAIYKGMKSLIACDVAPIKKVKPEDMGMYDVMALGCPVWAHREVIRTKILTHDMPRMDGKHAILFGTHGALPAGQFWGMSRNILKKGMTIIGWNDWCGPDLMLGHTAQPHTNFGHPDEIDLMEAEAFGRQMAEYSIRIYAGERDLIPEIPKPPKEETSLWSPWIVDGNIRNPPQPPEGSLPKFDLTKCVYPRCDQCIGNCPVNAIDFSVITPASTIDSPLIVKDACQNCGGICQMVCLYDAIEYEHGRIKLEIDMTNCIYPDCTLCIDGCPQDAIDFSKSPPVIHNWCEGDNLCWAICPKDAVIISNIETAEAFGGRRQMQIRGGVTAGTPPTEGSGEAAQGPVAGGPMAPSPPPKFRPLIREEDVGSRGPTWLFTNVPRFVQNKEDWPYEMDAGLNLFTQSNSLTAQAQELQPLSKTSLIQELLKTYSLPMGPVTANDIPRIKAVIRQVLNRISESIKAEGLAGNKADIQPVISAIVTFQDWLKRQGCVKRASNWYVNAIDNYDDDIFISHPGQVPFDILFNMGENVEKEDSLYRLMIFVNTVDLLKFASLAENRTIIIWPSYRPAPYLVPSHNEGGGS